MNAIERIISAIPPEAAFSEADRNETRKLLMACVLWALPYDGPSRDGIEELRSLRNGFGSWLNWVRQGINMATLTSNERGFFLGALGMATALLMSFSMPARESEQPPAPPPPPAKRNGRKKAKSGAPRSARRVSEIVLPAEWVG